MKGRVKREKEKGKRGIVEEAGRVWGFG